MYSVLFVPNFVYTYCYEYNLQGFFCILYSRCMFIIIYYSLLQFLYDCFKLKDLSLHLILY